MSSSPSAGISYTPAVLCNVTNTPATPNLPIAVVQTGNSGGAYTVSPSGLSINSTTGEINPSGATPGNYTIRYTVAGTGGCANFVATATLTGTAGGSYTTTTGLTIDQTTGTITPATSTPETYTVTYTVPSSPPCAGFTTSANVTVSLAPSAAISYNPATLCNVVNTPATPNAPVAVTQTGTTGGAYSVSPAGLSVNTTTGELNPSGAQAGTYTIKYSIPGAGGCTAYNVTTTVTINSSPTAVISYPGSPFCRGNNTPQRISLSGTPGGTYSAPAGLSLNAATGEIDPSLSTPGLYRYLHYSCSAALSGLSLSP